MADEQGTAEKQLLLQRLYIKDFSFESPKTPAIFSSNADTQIQLDVSSKSRGIDADNVEVVLTVTVKSVVQEDTVFLLEVAQAGVFTISGYTPEERFMALGTFCPRELYPYAREAITSIANKGGFLDLSLQPIDFDGLFAQSMQQRAEEAGRLQPARTAGELAPDNRETH